jgi:hypothetical protein
VLPRRGNGLLGAQQTFLRAPQQQQNSVLRIAPLPRKPCKQQLSRETSLKPSRVL